MRNRLARFFLGDRPLALLPLAVPTLIAVVIDVVLRGRLLWGYAPLGKLIYGSSLLISVAFWVLPSWIAARMFRARGRRFTARVGVILFSLLWVLPLATFCFAGQTLYHRVFHSYMGRDTVRLGIALRGTVGDWFAAWGSPLLLLSMIGGGAIVMGVIRRSVRRSATSLRGKTPVLPFLAFGCALICFWNDYVDSRFLQAATPDTCFVHGAVHALRAGITGKGAIRQGMSLRTPLPLPPLASAKTNPPNVVVILTESVRADAECSDPPPHCRATYLDDVVPDRIALGRLTTQTPNTFSSCMILWTGLAPNVDFRTAHSAPVVWEIAHAVGYRTAYVTSQNPKYEDFGTFFERAGIDVLVTATDLGGMRQEQLGAPDERAADAMRTFLKETPRPYFAVLQLSNTHTPYRTDPELLPFAPHSSDPLGDVNALHNHYRNSVAFQERMIASFLRDLRALPNWEDTVVVFLSDHGEQFREHGGLYHNHSLFEEELRIPGWIAGGSRALGPAQRAALRSYGGRRTYTQDVHATLIDLLGVEGLRSTLPLADFVSGRSLLQKWQTAPEPFALLATSTAVWEPDDARFGVMYKNRLLVGSPSSTWICFDMGRDPGERSPLPARACGAEMLEATRGFADGTVPPP